MFLLSGKRIYTCMAKHRPFRSSEFKFKLCRNFLHASERLINNERIGEILLIAASSDVTNLPGLQVVKRA
jgi:hypothetical protein